jgi:hypothetical protein
MADKKISALTGATTPLAGTEVLPIVQSGATVKVAVSDLTAGRSVSALGMTLTSTDAGATAAPLLDLYRDSASPAAADTLGEIEFNGEDSAGNKQAYALFHGSILSPTSGAEQGQLHFETATAGALTEKMIIGTSNLVINDIGAIYNVRIEGDTDANLFYTDATNDRIGVGTASPSAKLDVNGPVVVQGNYVWQQADGSGKGFLLGSSGSANGLISQTSGGSGSTATYIGNAQITTSSDVRLKENIVDSQRNALEIIDKIRIVDFTWNDPTDQSLNNKASRGVWTGLIAQEAVAHIPWLINKPTEDTEDGRPVYWNADYGHAVPFLMKAIQELKAELDSVKTELATLRGN